MSGASPVTRSCPNCGAPTDSILDPFTGETAHLDNFAEVEDYLREHGSLSTDAYDLYADSHTRSEYEPYSKQPTANRVTARSSPTASSAPKPGVLPTTVISPAAPTHRPITAVQQVF